MSVSGFLSIALSESLNHALSLFVSLCLYLPLTGSDFLSEALIGSAKRFLALPLPVFSSLYLSLIDSTRLF